MAAADSVTRAPARGLTLIEILIAVGIVVALSAIVLPIASWSFRLRPLEGARDGIESVVLQARAHARIEGRPVEVRLLDGRLEARWFDVTSASTGDDPDGFDQSAPEEGGGEFDAVDDSMIPMTWARRALPEGIEFLPLDEHMERLESRDAFGFESIDDGIEASGGFDPSVLDPIPLRLAVLLPDGGALVLEPVVLLDSEGVGLLMEIDPWTGRPLFEPAPVGEIEEPTGEDEDDVDDREGDGESDDRSDERESSDRTRSQERDARDAFETEATSDDDADPPVRDDGS